MKRLLPAIFFTLFLGLSCSEQEPIEPVNKLDNPYAQVNRLVDEARDIYKESPSKAEAFALKAADIAENEYYLEGEKEAHNLLYWIYLNELKDETKAAFHKAAFERANSELKASKDLAALNYAKGYRLYTKGNYTDALPFLLQAYDLYHSNNEETLAGNALYTVGLIFYKNDLADQGLRYVGKIDINSLSVSMQISALKLLGMLHFENATYSQAIEQYDQAMTRAESINDNLAAAHIMRAISLPLIETGQFERAKDIIKQGLVVAREVDNSQNLQGELLVNEAKLYEKIGQSGLALNSLSKAALLFEETDNFAMLAAAKQDLSHNHFILKNWQQAKAFALEGLQYKDEAKTNTVFDLYTNLSILSKELGDETGYYKYAHEALKVDHAALQSSQKLGLQKAELSYRNDSEVRDLEADIISHEAYMSQSRNIRWAIIGGIVLTLAVLFVLLLNYGPIRHYERRVDKAHSLGLNIMEQLDKIMKAMSLKSEKVSPPEGPDETDLHGRANKRDQD